MAFDPAQSTGDVWGFVKEHPVGIAVAVLGVVVLIYLYENSGSSAPTATGSADDSAINAAAAIQAAQTSANEQTAVAGIAAGVTNNQTTAAQTVALAQIQGQNDANAAAATATLGSAYYGAATEISANNTAGAIAATQAQETEQLSQNQTIASEFGNLSGVLTNFGNNTQSMVNNLNASPTTTGAPLAAVQPTLISPDFGLAAMTGGANAVYASIASVFNAQQQNAASEALANQENTTNANAAVSIAQTKAGATSGALSTMTGWLSSLFGSFSGSVAATAPTTAAPNMQTLASTNLAPLAAGPLGFTPSNISEF